MEPLAKSIECSDNFNFAYDVVDVITSCEPHRRALVWCSETGEEKEFSFGELAELSLQAANYLAHHGIGRGSRVMLIMKRHYAYWYILLALHRLGAVAIPATHMLTGSEIRYRIRLAKVEGIISIDEPELNERIKKAACEDIKLLCTTTDLEKDLPAYPAKMARQVTHYTDPMLLYFTSGTTGQPKAVLHNYAYPLYHIPTARDWQGVVNGGLHLSVADTGWAKASWGKIYGQWLCGSAVMVYHCNNLFVKDLLNVIKKYQVTTFCAPPTVYRSMIKNGFDADAFASVKRAVTAGESMKPAIAAEFKEKTGLTIYCGYGQTETALLTMNDSDDTTSLGKPMPMYALQLNNQGEILLKSRHEKISGICMGYLDAQGKLISPLDENGFFHTGDLARYDEQGNLVFEGRTDDVIKSSGYRISPLEIENAMITHPHIADCAVTGVADGERGYVVKALVVLKKGIEASRQEEKLLRSYALEYVESYKCPRIIEFCDHLPKTISGKIRRAALR